MTDDQAAYAAPYVPAPVAPVPPARPRKRTKLWRNLGIAGAIIAILGIGLSQFAKSNPAKFTVVGTIALSDTSDPPSIQSTGSGCAGTGGYSDIAAGTEVVIADGSGATLAIGNVLVTTLISANQCDLAFSVTGVPSGKSFYGVTVSHRGTIQFTEAQLKAGPALTIGS